MLIEFRNCSLEIGYIGTPDQIMMAILRDACQVAGHAMMDFARRYMDLLADAFERGALAGAKLRESMERLAEDRA
jgi:hypothetical protein